MDHMTTVGAVASIVTLAQTALSLSQTLYTLGSAVSSAFEDIQDLAEDLKTFAQSLTILSRLLEDSKSWYSDDIYLLTAKIIKECAELYEEIDKVLSRLGANGKTTWKLKVKFVYKEGQIRKLLKRLRGMKGTLATILMSLQVDLQLSLLNINSSSRFQRNAKEELQPATITTLEAAQEAVQCRSMLPNYGHILDKSYCSKISENTLQAPQDSTNMLHTESFIVIPENFPAFNSLSTPIKFPEKNAPVASLHHQGTRRNIETTGEVVTRTKGMRPIQSLDSFKSATAFQDSTEEKGIDVAIPIKAVESVLYAFRTAHSSLENLVLEHLKHDDPARFAATQLSDLFVLSGRTIKERCLEYYEIYSGDYLDFFQSEEKSRLHQISVDIMKEIIVTLYNLLDEQHDLSPPSFYVLFTQSKGYQEKAVDVMTTVASRVKHSRTAKPAVVPMLGCTFIRSQSSSCSRIPDTRSQQQQQRTRVQISGVLEANWVDRDPELRPRHVDLDRKSSLVHEEGDAEQAKVAEPPKDELEAPSNQRSYKRRTSEFAAGEPRSTHIGIFKDDRDKTIRPSLFDPSLDWSALMNPQAPNKHKKQFTEDLSFNLKFRHTPDDRVDFTDHNTKNSTCQNPRSLAYSPIDEKSPCNNDIQARTSRTLIAQSAPFDFILEASRCTPNLQAPQDVCSRPFALLDRLAPLPGPPQPAQYTRRPHSFDYEITETIATPNSRKALWWTAYENLKTTNYMRRVVLDLGLDPVDLQKLDQTQIAMELSERLKVMPTIISHRADFKEVLEVRDNIVRVMKMIDQQMGLGIAVVGWACMWRLINVCV
ncbi:hypothetical protein BJ875DRAFT_453600 [Amylocarpus encephaloides]|uniref:Azaphilone pigments biosynthesis cluster protein L N-terminal domain-containing protein n=1 Tax=Amylocarpus encephaloides TaxID=45428 RepID=A0A9P8C883_9HELO|nr:hypothetical protein BJ875DRAFT_453600 [Amylocarpus encephaloides]